MVLAHYITRLILSYAKKYIRNIEANVNWSLWNGDMQFNNLDLRLDVLQSSLGIPEAFQFSRGFIKSLRVQIPWSSLTTTPVEVTFTGVECVIDFSPNINAKQSSQPSSSQSSPRESTRNRRDSTTQLSSAQAVTETDSEVSGGWASDLISRIIANISIHVNDFTLKYRERDITASIHLKRFSLHSTDPSWRSTAFTDLLGPWKLMHKAVVIENIACFLYQHNPDLNHRHSTSTNSSDSPDDVEHQHMDDRHSQAACILSDLSLSVRLKSYLAALGSAIDVSAWAPSQSQSYSHSLSSPPSTIISNLSGPGVALVPRPSPPPCGSAITIDVHVTRSVHASLSCFQFERLYQLIQSQSNFYATTAAAARVAQSIAAVPARIDSSPTPIQPPHRKHRLHPSSNEPIRPSSVPDGTKPATRGWASWMWDAVAEEDDESTDQVDQFGSVLVDERAVFERDFGHLQPTNDLAFCLHIPDIELTLCDIEDIVLKATPSDHLSDRVDDEVHNADSDSNSASHIPTSTKLPFASLHIREIGMSLLQPLLLTTNVTRKHSRRMSEDVNNSQSSADVARPPTFAFNVVSLSVAVIDEPNVSQSRPIVVFGPDIPHHYLLDAPSTPIRRHSSSLNVSQSPSHRNRSQSCAHSPCLHRSQYWDMVAVAKAQSVIHALSFNHVVNRVLSSEQTKGASSVRYEPCIELTLAPLATTVDLGEPSTRRVFETLSIFWRPAAKERAETRSREQRWIEEKALLVSSLRTTIDELGSQHDLLQARIRELEEQLQAKNAADEDADTVDDQDDMLFPLVIRSRQNSAASVTLPIASEPSTPMPEDEPAVNILTTPSASVVEDVNNASAAIVKPRSRGFVRSVWSWFTLSDSVDDAIVVDNESKSAPRAVMSPIGDDVEILY